VLKEVTYSVQTLIPASSDMTEKSALSFGKTAIPETPGIFVADFRLFHCPSASGTPNPQLYLTQPRLLRQDTTHHPLTVGWEIITNLKSPRDFPQLLAGLLNRALHTSPKPGALHMRPGVVGGSSFPPGN
jgi:hypothetical protein